MNKTHWYMAGAVVGIWATLAACQQLTMSDEPIATAEMGDHRYPNIQATMNAALDGALAAAEVSAARQAEPDSRYATLVRILTRARDGNLATSLALQLKDIARASDAELREMEALIADDPPLRAKIVAITENLKAAFAAIPPIEISAQEVDRQDRAIGEPYTITSEHGAMDLGYSVLTVPEFLLRVQGQQGPPERGFAIDDEWSHPEWRSGRPWPSDKVLYYFVGLSGGEEEWMEKAMERMEDGTGIRFVESASAEWWLEFWHWLGLSNLLRINKEQLGSTPGWATVAKVGSSRLVMDTENVTVERHFNHEMGHVFGLLHEHQRYDRNTYVTVSDTKKNKVNYRIIPEHVKHCHLWIFCWYADNSTTYSTPYDYQSIMHYPKDAGIKLKRNHKAWVDNRSNNSRWGDENGDTWFTPWDIYTIKKLYGITPNPKPGYTPAAR